MGISGLQLQDTINVLVKPQEIHLTTRSSRNDRHFVLVTNLYEYIVNRTFHRPRDIIQFFLIQDSIKSLSISRFKSLYSKYEQDFPGTGTTAWLQV